MYPTQPSRQPTARRPFGCQRVDPRHDRAGDDGLFHSQETAEAAANASIGIETSRLFVTVENKSGAPMINMTVAIVSVAGQPFTRLLSRLENREKREIALGDFGGRDGTPFSLRVVRPKAVRVTAEDIISRKHDVEVRWR